jgi:hypothetical protein
MKTDYFEMYKRIRNCSGINLKHVTHMCVFLSEQIQCGYIKPSIVNGIYIISDKIFVDNYKSFCLENEIDESKSNDIFYEFFNKKLEDYSYEVDVKSSAIEDLFNIAKEGNYDDFEEQFYKIVGMFQTTAFA